MCYYLCLANILKCEIDGRPIDTNTLATIYKKQLAPEAPKYAFAKEIQLKRAIAMFNVDLYVVVDGAQPDFEVSYDHIYNVTNYTSRTVFRPERSIILRNVDNAHYQLYMP
jgi:maltose-binding protein MalE